MQTLYRIRQNIRGGKLSRFSRILAKRESFTIESFPSSQLENFLSLYRDDHMAATAFLMATAYRSRGFSSSRSQLSRSPITGVQLS